MASEKIHRYIVLTGLGFIVAISVTVFMFLQFSNLTVQYGEFSHNEYKHYTRQLGANNLSNMAVFLEKKYPVLHETGRLKQEAGSGWLWDMADEWQEIAETFYFDHVYYLEKTIDGYRFLLSSNIRRDEHPEWLGNLMWKNSGHPAFYDQAWKTEQLIISPAPYRSGEETLMTAAMPVMTDGNVSGLLCIDYDVSMMNPLRHQEAYLQKQEHTLTRKMVIIFVLTIIFIIFAMIGQMWLNNQALIVPIRERETEARTKLVLDATPMLCAIWDKDGRLLDCNAETLRVFNYENKAGYLEHFSELIPEYQPDGEKSRDRMARLTTEMDNNERLNLEWMYHTREGDELPLALTLVKVPWKNSYRITSYGRDLREIKAQEALAKESEKRIQVMLDSMSLACFLFDPEGNAVDCNRRAVDLFACKDKRECLEQLYNLWPEYQPDGRRSAEAGKNNISRVLEAEEKMVLPWVHLRMDGTVLPTEVTLVRVQWKDSYRAIAYIRDLSKLARTEDNLRRAQSIVETSPNLTMCVTMDGTIEFMNEAVIEVSGFSETVLIERGLSLIFSPQDYEILKKEYLVTAGRKPFNFEMPLITRYGEKRTIYFALFMVHMRYAHSCIGLIGRDVTDQKRMQRALELAKEQAERALESEKQYNKAKSNFLSRMSHELRTPMNAIIGMTDIARRAIERNERKNCLEKFDKIEEASKHLLHILNDVLDMTNIDTGKFTLEARQFSFSRAMRPLIEQTADKAAKKRHAFIVTIDEGIHDSLIGDERRIRQILAQLLSNAVKFTPEGGRIELSAKMKDSTASQCTIRFEVCDNGIGIGKDIQQSLGSNFEQEHNSITREYNGMGLGLSLSRRIVEMMNGCIWIESEEGQGSRFICDITLRIAASALEIPLTGNEMPEMNIEHLNGRRFLIVDDVEINRVIMFAILEETGAMLDEAKDGAEAVKLFSQNNYDMVLMDLHMPVMDGFSAAKNIRALDTPGAAVVPVISVSAESGADLPERLREAGITDHLAKPVEMEALFAMIAKWLPREQRV